MTISELETRAPTKSAPLDPDLEDAIREYLRTYVLWRGIGRATETFGVSRHTLWRFLRRGHAGRALPRAVLDTVGDSVEFLDAATWALRPSSVCSLGGQLPNHPCWHPTFDARH